MSSQDSTIPDLKFLQKVGLPSLIVTIVSFSPSSTSIFFPRPHVRSPPHVTCLALKSPVITDHWCVVIFSVNSSKSGDSLGDRYIVIIFRVVLFTFTDTAHTCVPWT